MIIFKLGVVKYGISLEFFSSFLLCLFYWTRLFVKTIIFNTKFQNSLKDPLYYRILESEKIWHLNDSPFNTKQNWKEKPALFRSDKGIFGMFFKLVLYQRYRVLQINFFWKYQITAITYHKMVALLNFCDIAQKPSFNG